MNMTEIANQAKEAGRVLGSLPGAVRGQTIRAMADCLAARRGDVLAANEEDIRHAETNGLTGPLLQRLKVSDKVFDYMVKRLKEAAALPDPLGVTSHGHIRPSGLKVWRVSVPLGVIAIIYESRPNVTTDAAAVCLKSGNAVILRGGSEAIRTNTLLAEIMREAASASGAPANAVQIVTTTDRAAVGELLQLDKYIDVVIPRGGKSLIERISRESRIPVIKHYEGLCHQYVADDADTDMAVAVVVNSKCEKVEVCNALETLLIDAKCVEKMLPPIAKALTEKGVELRGDERARQIFPMNTATDEDWAAEYLAPILSIRIVDGIDEAIQHINFWGSGHTDGIITSSLQLSDRFVSAVDSASVLVNASTRLSGGGDYGMGAVVGISTDKLHARGPVGPEELTSYKWVAVGNGHLRG
ncbi:MAG TPA: glutamate-5-semialdehyde dehydrogenase [Armatimonadota bacterium]|jgi:glutamate-5-semialdehyde dehydrogenase